MISGQWSASLVTLLLLVTSCSRSVDAGATDVADNPEPGGTEIQVFDLDSGNYMVNETVGLTLRPVKKCDDETDQSGGTRKDFISRKLVTGTRAELVVDDLPPGFYLATVETANKKAVAGCIQVSRPAVRPECLRGAAPIIIEGMSPSTSTARYPSALARVSAEIEGEVRGETDGCSALYSPCDRIDQVIPRGRVRFYDEQGKSLLVPGQNVELYRSSKVPDLFLATLRTDKAGFLDLGFLYRGAYVLKFGSEKNSRKLLIALSLDYNNESNVRLRRRKCLDSSVLDYFVEHATKSHDLIPQRLKPVQLRTLSGTNSLRSPSPKGEGWGVPLRSTTLQIPRFARDDNSGKLENSFWTAGGYVSQLSFAPSGLAGSSALPTAYAVGCRFWRRFAAELGLSITLAKLAVRCDTESEGLPFQSIALQIPSFARDDNPAKQKQKDAFGTPEGVPLQSAASQAEESRPNGVAPSKHSTADPSPALRDRDDKSNKVVNSSEPSPNKNA